MSEEGTLWEVIIRKGCLHEGACDVTNLIQKQKSNHLHYPGATNHHRVLHFLFVLRSLSQFLQPFSFAAISATFT